SCAITHACARIAQIPNKLMRDASVLPYRQGKTFTLIELLVVVAIIAILASVFLPTLATAKETGRRAKCLSNVGQLGIASMLYVTDNYDAFPQNGQVPDGGDPKHLRWVQGHMKHDTGITSDPTNTDLLVNPKYAQFAAYLKGPDIYKCPSDRTMVQ